MTTETKSKADVRHCVALLAIRDIDASLRFYVDGLGFTRTNQWVVDGRIRWCWLEHGTAALMLQETTAEHRHRFPEGQVGLGVSLNFICGDALAFYHEVKARGIPVQRPFVGNRMWVTSVKDPDGYQLHFESDTDVPEETEYQE